MSRVVQLGLVWRVVFIASCMYEVWESVDGACDYHVLWKGYSICRQIGNLYINQHPRKYYHDSPDGHQAFRSKDAGIRFQGQETLFIASDAYRSFQKREYHKLTRYSTVVKFLFFLVVFSSLDFTV